MRLRSLLGLGLSLLCVAGGSAWAGPINATIYFGNDAQFGSSATNPASNQGFTFLRDRWAAAGATVSLTDVFNPIGQQIFFATAPTTDFNAGQVSDLQTFLSAGGLLILSHDGEPDPALNTLLGDLGSAMSFGAIRFVGTVTATVVDPGHPLMAGVGAITTFSPGQLTGGSALVDFPLGTHIISIESVGGGHILNVADFDILNNVTDLFFPPGARPDNHQFWDNILGFAQQVPEPSACALLGVGLVGLFLNRRRGQS